METKKTQELDYDLVAWCIVERPDAAPAWVRCGTARLNRDGSVNVRLDALPLSGGLHIRRREPMPPARPIGQD